MELEEKLKVVAEYDGYVVKDFGAAHIRYIEQARSEEPYYEWQLLLDSEYHASFDWSVPVWNKCLKDLMELGIWSAALQDIDNRMILSIKSNKPEQYFNDLVLMILELQKAKQ